jgi:ectoine hydroxylase-related dioxygenase (phytanoyl-CoA dioxygenase family)
MQNIKEIITHAGTMIIPNFLGDEQLEIIRLHADEMNPVRGQDQNPSWVNPDKPETHPENWLDWSHYWTRQCGEDKEVQDIMRRLHPIVDHCLHEWQWWCVDYHVANPGAQYIRAHVDIPYIYEPWRNIHALLGLQMIIAIDDFTLDNGATAYLPRSHNNTELDISEIGTEKLNEALLHRGERLAVRAGGLLIYHPRTLHSTMPNITNEPRRALLFNAVETSIVDQLKQYDPVCWPENMDKNLKSYSHIQMSKWDAPKLVEPD